MSISSTLLLPLLLLASPPEAPSAAENLVWGPKENLGLRRDIESRHLLAAELQSMSKGEQRTVSQRRFELKVTQQLSVTDRMLESSAERPLSLSRHYNDSNFTAFTEMGKPGGKNKINKLKASSSLIGKGVRFTWVPEDANYGRMYDALEGTEEVLPWLSEGLTYQGLLPGNSVALGDTWELPPGVIGQLIDCGGRTDLQLANDVGKVMYRTMRLGVGLNADRLFGEQESGTVKARLVGFDESDGGHKLAVIDLDFDVEAERDMRNMARVGMSNLETASGVDVDTALVNIKLIGKAQVRWDIDGKHLHDMEELKADERLSTTLIKSQGNEEGRVLETQELVMVGTMYHSIKVYEE